MSDESDDDSNLGSSAPPPAQAATATAEQLRSSHPLWTKAAGLAPRQPRDRPGGADGDADKPRYEPLSALALELECFRANADGDSALFSEAGDSTHKRKRASAPAEDDDDDDDGGEFSALVASDDDDGPTRGRGRGKKKKKTDKAATGDAAMFAQAAFGGQYGDHSDAESVSQMSGTSSQRKKEAYKAAFPIAGVDCVGCMLVKQIAPVTRFIKTHLDDMADEALFKSAALTYVREVQEPRKKEGVLTPSWSWKDLRSHYLLHCSDHVISRTFAVKQLQTMRYALESRLMRVEGGEKTIDKGGAEMMLKVIKAESSERMLLLGGSKKVNASTVGDAGK